MIHLLKYSFDGVNGRSVLAFAERTLRLSQASENSANGLFENITYVKSRPIYDYNNPNEDKSKWFFYKNSVWKYEKEIRGLIFPPANIKNERYRKVLFPKEALQEIIFGVNFTDKSTYDEVICLCKEHGFQNIRFSYMQATTDSDSYKLIKEPIATN